MSRTVFVLGVFSAFPEHILPAVNQIVGHGIITLRFFLHGNGSSACFLAHNTKFYRVTMVLETQHFEIPTSH